MLKAAVIRICRASSRNNRLKVKAIAPTATPTTALQPPASYIRPKITSDNHSLAIHGRPWNVCDKSSTHGKEPPWRIRRPTPMCQKVSGSRRKPSGAAFRRRTKNRVNTASDRESRARAGNTTCTREQLSPKTEFISHPSLGSPCPENNGPGVARASRGLDPQQRTERLGAAGSANAQRYTRAPTK